MFTKPLFIFFVLNSFLLLSQHSTLHLNSFFKDKLFNDNLTNNHLGSSFFPALDSDKNIFLVNQDTASFKNQFINHLFQKHLVEVEGADFHLSISPIIHFSIGKDQTNSIQKTLFRNVRGFYIEGKLKENLTFVSTFSENQARYSLYETNFYAEHGELFPVDSLNYQIQNAVIPGAARTKPFKENGFDYSYATGLIAYQPFKKMTILAGNSPQFIGDGYRSVLLSDNALPAPFFKLNFRLKKKWEINYMRMRVLNLIRKPASNSVEAYYDPKALSVNFITYHFSPKIAVSFFEGILWTIGDAIQTNRLNPWFYSPIPFLAELTQNDQQINSIVGMNVSIASIKNSRIYSQLAIGSLEKAFAFQIGLRAYSPFGLNNTLLQLEYNQASENMYKSRVARLNYSSGNLPIAHSAGNAFSELIVRFNSEYKRFYFDLKSNVYHFKNYSSQSLLPVLKINPLITTILFLQAVEIGYRINKKMNLCLFSSWQYRSDFNKVLLPTNQLFIGIKTAITNHYNDF